MNKTRQFSGGWVNVLLLAGALWALLWVGLQTDYQLFRAHDVSGTDLARATIAPLVLVGALAAFVVAHRSGSAMRAYGPVLLLALYGIVGLLASLLWSPDPARALYWGFAFLAPVLVCLLLLARPTSVQSLGLLLRANGFIAVVILVLLVAEAIRVGYFADFQASGRRIFGSRYDGASQLWLTANGMGRFGAVVGLIAVCHFLGGEARWRLYWIPFAILGLYVTYASVSRTALFGLAVALLVAIWLHRGLRAALVLASVAAGALLLLLGPDISDYLARGQDPGSLLSLSGRIDIWVQALPAIAESPLVGWGFHGDRLVLGDHMHNAWMHALVQGGAIGLVAFGAAWFLVWRGLGQEGLLDRFRRVPESERLYVIDAAVLLTFFTVRSLTESTAAFFGVDLLLIVPIFGYVHALRRPSAGPGPASPAGPPFPPARRRNVLVVAYACAPPGSATMHSGEDLLGWRLVTQVARFHNTWALVSEEHRESVTSVLRRSPAAGLRFAFVDLPRWLHPLRRLAGGIQAYAYLWQIRAHFAARELHRQVRFDLVHHATYANDWMASYVGAFLPVPFVRGPGGGAHKVPHSFRAPRGARFRIGQSVRGALQRLLRLDPVFRLGQSRASALLVCTPEAREAVPRRWRQKVHMFPVTGIVPAEATVGVNRPRRGGTRGLELVTASRLLPNKAVDLSLRTVAALRARGVPATLTVVGDGPERGRLETLAVRLGVQAHVVFRGHVSQPQVLREVAAGDVFLFPGLRDGGGAVVVEAMAVGRPVVCLALAGPGLHVTPACGFAVPAGHPDQAVAGMADACERLWHDPKLRARLGRAGRERALAHYDWNRLGERLARIYDRVLPPPTTAAGRPVTLRDASPSHPGFHVLGTRLSSVTRATAVDFMRAAIERRQQQHVCVCSVNMVMTARRDPELRRALETAGMVVPDGRPLAALGRRRSPLRVEQVRGTDLMNDTCRLAAARGYRVFFYGGARGIARRVARELERRHPGLIVAGTHSPPYRPLTPREDAAMVRRINAARPDIVWVGLGCPKQEKWMVEQRGRLEAPVLVGVGAAFDFVSGKVSEAPRWVRRSGAEWLWRFGTEPRRLWRRVALEGPAFVALATWEGVHGAHRTAVVRNARAGGALPEGLW